MEFDLFGEFSEDELLLIDITFIGLNQMPWDYSRGARTERLYYCVNVPDKLKIRDYYSYTMTNGNREVTLPMSRQIEWYRNDGSIGLTKTITKQYTVKSIGELNQEIRNGRLTDLVANAHSVTGGDALVDAIYAWYGDLIAEYIDRGTLTFENALKNETDPTRLATLNASIVEFGGLSVMQLLSFQLVGTYDWS